MAPHLISVDEPRAAGALDVPPEWRKFLGPDPRPQRDLFSDLPDENESQQDSACPAADADGK